MKSARAKCKGEFIRQLRLANFRLSNQFRLPNVAACLHLHYPWPNPSNDQTLSQLSAPGIWLTLANSQFTPQWEGETNRDSTFAIGTH